MIKLATLLPSALVPPSLAGLAVAGLSSDSRLIQPGFVFFAVPGAKADGGIYVADALKRGAIAVVGETVSATPGMPFVPVADVRTALSQAAARFYPRQPQTIVASSSSSRPP